MFNLKHISSLNVDLVPFSSENLYKRLSELKSCFEVNIENISDDDLVIFCIQNAYAYRTGVIGWLSTLLSSKLSEYYQPTFLQNIVNINANDFEIVSGAISLISRGIPLLNICVWDNKNFQNNIFKYGYGFGNKNDSIPSIFNLKSNYLLNPFFDSGCAIYSNKIPFATGFEEWNYRQNKYYNNGIVWSYFRNENKGIMILNLTIDKSENFPLFQIIQLCELKDELQKKYSKNIEQYETYICGEFNIEFNISNIIPEINDKLNLLKKSDINIFKNNCITNTNHILYSNIQNNFKIESKKFENVSENVLTSIEFSEKYFEINLKDDIDVNSQVEVSKVDTRVEDVKIEVDTRVEDVKIEVETQDEDEDEDEFLKVNVNTTNNLIFNSKTIGNYFKNSSSDEEEWLEVI